MGQFRIIENSSFLTTRPKGIEILLWYAGINNTFLSFHSLLPCSKVWPKKGPNINQKNLKGSDVIVYAGNVGVFPYYCIVAYASTFTFDLKSF